MSLSLHVLREKTNVLLELFHDHLQIIQNVQRTFIDKRGKGKDIYNDTWLNDTGSIFRLLKREDFDAEKLPEAIEALLEWRSKQDLTGPSEEGERHPDILNCLTPPAHDHLGRPVVLVKLSNVQGTAAEIKQDILSHFEFLRLQLYALNSEKSAVEDPLLQCVFIVDIANAGGMNVASEVVPWLVSDISPNYHGITSAIYFVNYSMFYSGVWSLAKRVIPQYILDKISFVTTADLLKVFPIESIPEEYGGTLKLSEEDKVLTIRNGHSLLTSDSVYKRERERRRPGWELGSEQHRLDPGPSTISNGQPLLTSHDNEIDHANDELNSNPQLLPDTSNRLKPLSRTSSRNPFFGYRFNPTLSYSAWLPSFSNDSDTYQHRSGNIHRPSFLDAKGNPCRRRRLADLLHTLLRMYYRRWGSRILVVLLGIVFWFLIKKRGRIMSRLKNR